MNPGGAACGSVPGAASRACVRWLRGVFLAAGFGSVCVSSSFPAHGAGVTFSRDIAPLMYRRCSGCHRPGQAAPFPLLSYADFKKHAAQIAEVTEARLMPPWLPEAGHVPFADERRLTEEELALLRAWREAGGPEGDPTKLPTPPQWPDGWTLGKPDLIVTLDQPYHLPAEGRDVYRNLVIPVPVANRRFVRGVEFRPGNPSVVHHAFVNVDESPYSRRLAAKANPPGFDGMVLPETSRMPGGHFLGWQPGKVPAFAPEGLSWVLNPGADLVLQLHLHPSGKPESVQPSVGFYFTDAPPTNQLVRLNLSQLFIDIPAGATNYWIERSYRLPVDVELTGVNPHCHYLGKELQGFATLPDGTRKWLLRIPRWDFNWQGDYRYREPQHLPRGTTLHMRFSYDNSTNNIANPNHPPRRVTYGLQTTDEMGELWYQVLVRNVADRQVLLRDFHGQLTRWSLEYNRHLVDQDPADAVARTKVARALHVQGLTEEAIEHLTAAVAARPDYDKAHYELGFIYLRQKKWGDATREFEAVIRLNPDDYEAEGSLGTIHLMTGNLDEARKHLARALEINPADEVARGNLKLLMEAPAARGR